MKSNELTLLEVSIPFSILREGEREREFIFAFAHRQYILQLQKKKYNNALDGKGKEYRSIFELSSQVIL